MKTLFGTLFGLHCLTAMTAFLTMDLDVGRGALRRALDYVIDSYEAVGFGEFFTGVTVVTIVVGGVALWAWARARKARRAKP